MVTGKVREYVMRRVHICDKPKRKKTGVLMEFEEKVTSKNKRARGQGQKGGDRGQTGLGKLTAAIHVTPSGHLTALVYFYRPRLLT